jgi:hypothetical protein
MRAVIALLLAAAGTFQQAPVRPDFSGQWTLDQQRSTSTPTGVAGMLGSSFTAKQDAKTLTLDISIVGGHLQAIYNLDGADSRNVMPGPAGDEVIVSRATWDADRLVIVTRSTEMQDGKSVGMETRRVMWIGTDGLLVLERSGTPAALVPTTRSVYRRAKDVGQSPAG